jgi:hypothetical protein
VVVRGLELILYATNVTINSKITPIIIRIRLTGILLIALLIAPKDLF